MLDHATLRTHDLEGTRSFFEKVLGLETGYRPAFSFPGYWLYAGGEPVVLVRYIKLDGHRPGVHVDGLSDTRHLSSEALSGIGGHRKRNLGAHFQLGGVGLGNRNHETKPVALDKAEQRC